LLAATVTGGYSLLEQSVKYILQDEKVSAYNKDNETARRGTGKQIGDVKSGLRKPI